MVAKNAFLNLYIYLQAHLKKQSEVTCHICIPYEIRVFKMFLNCSNTTWSRFVYVLYIYIIYILCCRLNMSLMICEIVEYLYNTLGKL